MKKNAFLVASALVCASVPAFADGTVDGGNIFGILTVESKSADTIVAVPWCECSTNDNQSVSISNIVKTANLTVGDELYSLNSSREKLYKWVLESEGGTNYWQGYRMVSNSGTVDNAIPSASATAVRGTAIILHRQNPITINGVTTNAVPFYLYGQVGTNSTVNTVIASGSSAAPAYTLIAPPIVSSSVAIPGEVMSGMQSGDSIVTRSTQTGVNREYTYNGSQWEYITRTHSGGKITTVTNKVDSISLACGTGAWYVSRNTTAPTLTWKNLPHK